MCQYFSQDINNESNEYSFNISFQQITKKISRSIAIGWKLRDVFLMFVVWNELCLLRIETYMTAYCHKGG